MLHKQLTQRSKVFKSILLSSAFLLSACGSSSNEDQANAEISGSVFASSVSGASVVVTDMAGNQLAGPVTSDSSGRFTVTIPNANLQDDLVFIATGGSYQDEASGNTTTNVALKSLVSGDSLDDDGTISLSISPESTLIHRLVDEHDKSISQAKTLFEEAFGYEFDPHVLPVDVTIANDQADAAQKLAGLRAAAFSQLTQELGLAESDQFDLLNALADDLSDGELNGMESTASIDVSGISLDGSIQARFAQAFMNFKDSERHLSGLKNNQLGQMPFNKIAMTESYKVTYVPSEMANMSGMEQQGKSSFKFKVSDHEGTPQSGLDLNLNVVMNMEMHTHSTPTVEITEDQGEAGTYLVTVYYLMPSVMMNGTSMGYWVLNVTVDDETAAFFPRVGMAMGTDTVRANLKGQDDQVMNMMQSLESRPYYLFKHALQHEGDTTTFKVFIATRESMMLFPTLVEGLTLNDSTEQELTINSISVRMSLDEENWTTASLEGNGIWSADFSTLVAEEDATIYVELTVNGEQKTDDGEAPDGLADNAMFMLTIPSSSMPM